MFLSSCKVHTCSEEGTSRVHAEGLQRRLGRFPWRCSNCPADGNLRTRDRNMVNKGRERAKEEPEIRRRICPKKVVGERTLTSGSQGWWGLLPTTLPMPELGDWLLVHVSCNSWPEGALRPNEDCPGRDQVSTPALEKRGSFLPVLLPWKILMAVFCGASGQKDEAASALVVREEWVLDLPHRSHRNR